MGEAIFGFWEARGTDLGDSELFTVTIVFEQSHLFFPRIIHWVLLLLFLLILVFVGRPYLQAVKSGSRSLPFTEGQFDQFRFFGTLVLTVVYFVLMESVGEYFPNTGLGFLIVSIPYMFLLSLIYLHHRDRRHLVIISINSLVAPVVAWYVLARVFGITLP